MRKVLYSERCYSSGMEQNSQPKMRSPSSPWESLPTSCAFQLRRSDGWCANTLPRRSWLPWEKASNLPSSIQVNYIDLREWPLLLLRMRRETIFSIHNKCRHKLTLTSHKELDYSIGNFQIAWSSRWITARYLSSRATSLRRSRQKICHRRRTSCTSLTATRPSIWETELIKSSRRVVILCSLMNVFSRPEAIRSKRGRARMRTLLLRTVQGYNLVRLYVRPFASATVSSTIKSRTTPSMKISSNHFYNKLGHR